MVLSTIANWALRAAQGLFGIVILGLSVTLIRGHHWGDLPSSLGYAAFVGGISILAAGLGVVGSFVSFLQGFIGMAIDGLVAVISIIGGIVLAVKTKGVSCSFSENDVGNAFEVVDNDLFNGGCYNNNLCWLNQQNWSQGKMKDYILGHCRESKADMVFMFLTGGLFLATALLLLLKHRKG